MHRLVNVSALQRQAGSPCKAGGTLSSLQISFLPTRLEIIKISMLSLAGVVKWLEYWPAHGKVACLIPGRGHVPGLQVRSLG